MKLALSLLISTIALASSPKSIKPEAAIAKTATLFSGGHAEAINEFTTIGIGPSIMLNKTNNIRIMISKSIQAAPEKFDNQHNEWMDRVTNYTSLEFAYKHAFGGDFNWTPFIGCTVAHTSDTRSVNARNGGKESIKKNGGYTAFLAGYNFGKHIAIELQIGIPRYSLAVSCRF